MATSIAAAGLNKAQRAAQAAASHLATTKSKKLDDLSRDTVNAHTGDAQTTDHGVRVENSEQWLRAADERKTGPSLLEDQIAREKVWIYSEWPRSWPC